MTNEHSRKSQDDDSDPEWPQVSMTTRVAAPVAADPEAPWSRARELTPRHRYFTALHDTASCVVAVVGLDGIAREWGEGAQALFGYRADEVVGKSLGLLVHELNQQLVELPQRVREHGRAELNVRLRRKDGTSVEVAVVACAVRASSGEVEAMALLMRDISDQIALERRMQSLGQLEALTRVAAGFAHDLNNILTIAGTYQSFVADSQLSASQSADLKVARDAVERGAVLVERLLALSQNRAVSMVVTDLNDVVRGTEATLARFMGESIQLQVKLAAQPVPIRAGTGQLDQILLNLALNARDAMPDGGTLSIGVRSATVGGAHPLRGQLALGTYAVVSVKDTGTGIDQQTLPHVFEAFFTTKPLGEGTGLGLLIVRDIVSQLRGAVRIETSVGVGTEFEVYLPVFEAPPYVESIRPPDGMPGRKTILVVDEDDAIRNALQRVLRAEGYSVLLASDGVDASDIAARHQGPIDLLLCDLHQSREDGRQTLARIRPTRPQLRVLFLSGSPVKAGYVDLEARVVRKPFTPEMVISAVAEHLERPVSMVPRPLPERPVVLVVDDDLEVRQALLRLLGESDLELLGAKSGLHALQLLEEQHVDLVVSDQMMPGMDGVQFLEAVRERWPHCQRVLLTGHASSDVVLGAVNRGGVTRVLTKTMHPVAIRDELEHVALSSPRFGAPLSLPKSSR
jgi:two-component system, cell cycle sensor histidine kinase and response regulator CckA